ncbi:hypothetical protein JZ751_028201 [Albula glossodonta]|uniref:Uncharacterized protein n=1 Tax=Albula glossodonta TaxID=121402 RepID=A0A8T2P8G2_9TELE|nr:hypothetical protein JZ751_028201 [Albula glossodonta]
MAPALTETASDGCGIHLSSPGVNLDGSLLGMEVDQQQILMEDDCTQAAWLNLTFLPSPDTCSKDTLEVQTPFLSPLVQSSGSYRTMLHSSPGTLLNLLSLNKSLASPLLPSPQSPDVYFLSVSDHDGMGSERTFRNMSTQQPLLTECCLGEDETQAQTARPLLPWGKMGRKAGWHQDQAQPRSVVLEEAFLSQVQQCCSRQHTLLRQTTRVQRRLQALLGEHATRHCSLQLHGLIRTCFEGDAPPGSPFPLEPHSPLDKKPFNTPIGLEDGEERGPWSNITLSSPPQKVPSPLKRPADVKTFVCCTKAVMSGLQDVLDSDATDSSSDEEWNLEGAQGANCVPM